MFIHFLICFDFKVSGVRVHIAFICCQCVRKKKKRPVNNEKRRNIVKLERFSTNGEETEKSEEKTAKLETRLSKFDIAYISHLCMCVCANADENNFFIWQFHKIYKKTMVLRAHPQHWLTIYA